MKVNNETSLLEARVNLLLFYESTCRVMSHNMGYSSNYNLSLNPFTNFNTLLLFLSSESVTAGLLGEEQILLPATGVIKQPAGSERCHNVEEWCLSDSERLIIKQSLDWSLLTTWHEEYFSLLKPKGSFLPSARAHEIWRSVPDLKSLLKESVIPTESLLAVTESCDIRVRSTPHTRAVLKS